jgi:hypothetical protein
MNKAGAVEPAAALCSTQHVALPAGLMWTSCTRKPTDGWEEVASEACATATASTYLSWFACEDSLKKSFWHNLNKLEHMKVVAQLVEQSCRCARETRV